MNSVSKATVNAQVRTIGSGTSETQLVAAAIDRSEAAVRELVRRNNPRLFRVARGIVSSDAEAEDVVQETYLIALTHLDSFRAGSSFSTWITRIAINNALMRLRRDRHEQEYDTVKDTAPASILLFPGQASGNAEVQLGRHQLQQLLEETVAGLPPKLRLVFVMREAEGMALKEIARNLEVNPITVKTRLFRARKWLKAELERRMRGGFDSIFPFNGKRCADMADRVVERLPGLV